LAHLTLLYVIKERRNSKILNWESLGSQGTTQTKRA